jgi:hypothetical protein
MDRSSFHMHHKFAVVDDRILLTGSYNWTRGAADNNEENLIVTDDPRFVKPYVEEFARLYDQSGDPDHLFRQGFGWQQIGQALEEGVLFVFELGARDDTQICGGGVLLLQGQAAFHDSLFHMCPPVLSASVLPTPGNVVTILQDRAGSGLHELLIYNASAFQKKRPGNFFLLRVYPRAIQFLFRLYKHKWRVHNAAPYRLLRFHCGIVPVHKNIVYPYLMWK